MKIKSNLDFESQAKITGLPNPISDTDAANKGYVDGAVEGISWKDSVRVATTAAIATATALEAGDAIDGITLAQGDRILVKDQAVASENGIYIASASGAAARSPDADAWDDFESAVVSVEEGTTNGGTTWRQSEVNGTLDTNDLVWGNFGTGSPAASETVSGISERATQAETDTGTDDARHITPLKLKTSAHVVKRHAELIGDAAATTITVTHNFGTKNVTVELFEAGGDEERIQADWSHNTVNAIDVGPFASAPASNAIQVVILG